MQVSRTRETRRSCLSFRDVPMDGLLQLRGPDAGDTPGLGFTAINDARRFHSAVAETPAFQVECTGFGSSAYLCASQDEIDAGVRPTMPYRKNCSAPLSGPREP